MLPLLLNLLFILMPHLQIRKTTGTVWNLNYSVKPADPQKKKSKTFLYQLRNLLLRQVILYHHSA